jgi:signal transduction histidine kinase
MKLRPRLALSVLAAAVPLTGAIAWIRIDIEHRAQVRAVRDMVLTSMESGGREACEARPESFPGEQDLFPMRGPGGKSEPPGFGPPPKPSSRREPGRKERVPPPEPRSGSRSRSSGPPPPPRRLEMFAYDASFVSANPNAPPFPEPLIRKLKEGAESADLTIDSGERKGLQVAVRMPWGEGPCAVVLARSTRRGQTQIDSEFLEGALIITAGVMGAVLLAAGPIVRRIRKLTAEVRRSAASRYTEPVGIAGQDEISQLAVAFNDAGKELRTHLSSLAKREETLRSFVANTTHDVMLPLTVLQGHLTAMRNSIDSRAQPSRETVVDALEEAHYMASLVQNLGAAVKLEAGEANVKIHPVDLNGLVERVIGRHKPVARQVSLDFSVPEAAAWTEGDVTLIEQAVSNVVHNAVRYNNPGGHVVVILEETGSDPPLFSLRVIDDGPGISDEALARIAERSFRTDEARRRCPEGLGLGLHIAKSVAARHGFSFRISRREAGGLEVEFQGKLIGPPVGQGPPQR